MTTKEEKLQAFSRLLDVMDRLRRDCPWDRKQTNESLRANTIEEVYELCDALLKNESEEIKKELGDVLLHVVFYAKIGEEKSLYDIASICNALCDKLIYRHPHIYGETQVNSTDEVLRNWEELKLKEKNGNKRTMSGVPTALPSLVKAQRIGEKAHGVGFDWSDKIEALKKVEEEIAELKIAIDENEPAHIEEELGDLLFSVVNVARHYGINADNALEKSNQKFIQRFEYIENESAKRGLPIKMLSLQEMDLLWEEAKKKEL